MPHPVPTAGTAPPSLVDNELLTVYRYRMQITDETKALLKHAPSASAESPGTDDLVEAEQPRCDGVAVGTALLAHDPSTRHIFDSLGLTGDDEVQQYGLFDVEALKAMAAHDAVTPRWVSHRTLSSDSLVLWENGLFGTDADSWVCAV